TSGIQGPLNMPQYYFGGNGNTWGSGIAAGPGGEVTVAYDTYDAGDYDAGLHIQTDRQAGNKYVAATTRFEARPSVAYDAKGRLWVAYEEGPELWGKDYGALAPDKGNPLYNERSVRVLCLEGGKLYKPVAELPTSRYAPPVLPFEAPKTNK